jgi:hypothetical protein
MAQMSQRTEVRSGEEKKMLRNAVLCKQGGENGSFEIETATWSSDPISPCWEALARAGSSLSFLCPGINEHEDDRGRRVDQASL